MASRDQLARLQIFDDSGEELLTLPSTLPQEISEALPPATAAAVGSLWDEGIASVQQEVEHLTLASTYFVGQVVATAFVPSKVNLSFLKSMQ